MIKVVLFILIAVIIGLLVRNTAEAAYADYRHQAIVKECKSQLKAPKWAEGLEGTFCERWAD